MQARFCCEALCFNARGPEIFFIVAQGSLRWPNIAQYLVSNLLAGVIEEPFEALSWQQR